LEPVVLDLLRHLYGREPFAFQTLNFAVGSEQHFHSDAVHFHSYPNGFMCGVWIALQDVQPESGPLIYFPGSHRLPYLSARSLGLDRDVVMEEQHPQRFFEPSWQQAVNAHAFEKQQFLPKRGDLLIWHANLLHGGEPVQDKSSRRWSQVNHYFFANCLYTTPMRNFASGEGGTCLRNPFDIAKGTQRFEHVEWQDLNPTLSGV
jgi:ectoine hydroxylase-related dioxygenase (phytanoyl-CoA dioxygenase family)